MLIFTTLGVSILTYALLRLALIRVGSEFWIAVVEGLLELVVIVTLVGFAFAVVEVVMALIGPGPTLSRLLLWFERTVAGVRAFLTHADTILLSSLFALIVAGAFSIKAAAAACAAVRNAKHYRRMSTVLALIGSLSFFGTGTGTALAQRHAQFANHLEGGRGSIAGGQEKTDELTAKLAAIELLDIAAEECGQGRSDDQGCPYPIVAINMNNRLNDAGNRLSHPPVDPDFPPGSIPPEAPPGTVAAIERAVAAYTRDFETRLAAAPRSAKAGWNRFEVQPAEGKVRRSDGRQFGDSDIQAARMAAGILGPDGLTPLPEEPDARDEPNPIVEKTPLELQTMDEVFSQWERTHPNDRASAVPMGPETVATELASLETKKMRADFRIELSELAVGAAFGEGVEPLLRAAADGAQTSLFGEVAGAALHPLASEALKTVLAQLSRQAYDRLLELANPEEVTRDLRDSVRAAVRTSAIVHEVHERSRLAIARWRAEIAPIRSVRRSAADAIAHLNLGMAQIYAAALRRRSDQDFRFTNATLTKLALQARKEMIDYAGQWSLERSRSLQKQIADLRGKDEGDRIIAIRDMHVGRRKPTPVAIAMAQAAEPLLKAESSGHWGAIRAQLGPIVEGGRMAVSPEKIARAQSTLAAWKRFRNDTALRRLAVASPPMSAAQWDLIFYKYSQDNTDMAALWGFAIISLDPRKDLLKAIVRQEAPKEAERYDVSQPIQVLKVVSDAKQVSLESLVESYRRTGRASQEAYLRRQLVDLLIEHGAKPYMGYELFVREAGFAPFNKTREFTQGDDFGASVTAICPMG